MTDNMVRTQVYLPRATYEALQTRGAAQGLTLAEQIRAALDQFLLRQGLGDEANDPVLSPDDPIFEMAGMFDSGVDDLGHNHDHYLYGMPKKPRPDDRRLREPGSKKSAAPKPRRRGKRKAEK